MGVAYRQMSWAGSNGICPVVVPCKAEVPVGKVRGKNHVWHVNLGVIEPQGSWLGGEAWAGRWCQNGHGEGNKEAGEGGANIRNRNGVGEKGTHGRT